MTETSAYEGRFRCTTQQRSRPITRDRSLDMGGPHIHTISTGEMPLDQRVHYRSARRAVTLRDRRAWLSKEVSLTWPSVKSPSAARFEEDFQSQRSTHPGSDTASNGSAAHQGLDSPEDDMWLL